MRGHGLEKLRAFLDRHVQHIGDAFAAVYHFQRFAVVTLAVAFVAGDEDIGQKMHFDLDRAVALARLAAPAFDVERKPPGRVTARFGFRQSGKPVADGRERAGIGGGVRTRRAANGRLVDIDDFVDQFDAVDRVMRRGEFARKIQFPRQRLVQRFNHQSRFAAARNARDAGKCAKRKIRARHFSDYCRAP